MKSDDSGTKWSLNVANITEDTTFNCVAQNSLGVANWTIHLNVLEGNQLAADWQSSLVDVQLDDKDDEVVLSALDSLPENLRDPVELFLKISNLSVNLFVESMATSA